MNHRLNLNRFVLSVGVTRVNGRVSQVTASLCIRNLPYLSYLPPFVLSDDLLHLFDPFVNLLISCMCWRWDWMSLRTTAMLNQTIIAIIVIVVHREHRYRACGSRICLTFCLTLKVSASSTSLWGRFSGQRSDERSVNHTYQRYHGYQLQTCMRGSLLLFDSCLTHVPRHPSRSIDPIHRESTLRNQ